MPAGISRLIRMQHCTPAQCNTPQNIAWLSQTSIKILSFQQIERADSPMAQPVDFQYFSAELNGVNAPRVTSAAGHPRQCGNHWQ